MSQSIQKMVGSVEIVALISAIHLKALMYEYTHTQMEPLL